MIQTGPRWQKYTVLIVFLWLTINFFPGSYSVDSWYQFDRMMNMQFDDWHSPWLAYVWWALQFTTHRFFSLYVLQMAGYFAMVYFLLDMVQRKWVWWLGLCASIGLVFVPQYVMKDSHLAIVWGSASIILLRGKAKGPWMILGTLGLLAYGLFLRLNTLAALLPLLYLLIDQVTPRDWTRMKKMVTTAVSVVVLVLFYLIVTYKVFATERSYPEYKLRLLDVLGISKLSGTNYVPPCIATYEGYNYDTLISKYNPASIDPLYWPYTGTSMIPRPSAELDACVAEAWKKAIKEHPTLYLKNRSEGFLYYLRIKKNYKDEEYWNLATAFVAPHPNTTGTGDDWTPLTGFLSKIWVKSMHYEFYSPWVWLVLNLILFGWFVFYYIRLRTDWYKVMLCIQLSALLFTFGMLPVYQSDRDFRYSYWNVFAVFIGGIAWLGRREPVIGVGTESAKVGNELTKTSSD